MKKLAAYKKNFREFVTDADFINKTIKSLNLAKNSKILDIGTGIGAMSTLLALNGFHVLTGEPEIDPERDKMNEHDHQYGDFKENHHENHEECNWGDWNDWRESAKVLGVEDRIKYQYFDVEDLPFSNEAFDGIFLYDTLQHVKNREIALNKCLRTLNSNGVIVVIEWTMKQIEEDYKNYGYKIEFIDPRDYIKQADVSTKLLKGDAVNIYILRKK